MMRSGLCRTAAQARGAARRRAAGAHCGRSFASAGCAPSDGAGAPRWALGFVAGLTYEDLGVTFDEAYSLLQDVPEQQIRDFEDELLAKHGQRVVFGSKDVSVVDTITPPEVPGPLGDRTGNRLTQKP